MSIEPAPNEPGEGDAVTGEQEKWDVITTIGRMGAKAGPAVPSLVRVLAARRGDEQGPRFFDEKDAAARALGRIGPAAKNAVPFLVTAMRTETRRSAARALGRMGATAVLAVPDLVGMLAAEPFLSSLATQVLGSIGPGARAVVPALINRLNHKSPAVAADAAVALLRIDPTKRDLVEARLRSIPVMSHLHARAILSGALGRRTPEADGFARLDIRAIDSSLQRLADPTGDGELWIQENELEKLEYSMERLSRLGAGAEGAIARLDELTRHPEPEVRRLASETLKRIRPR